MTLTLAVFLLAIVSGLAAVQKDFFQNADLSNGNNYSPSGLPSSGSDVLLATISTALTLNGASLSMSSLNQANNLSYVISAGGTISLGPDNGNVVGANGNDAIYLGGSNSSLSIQGVPLQMFGGNFDVAQPGSSLSISGSITLITGTFLTKTGAGVLNLSGQYTAFGSGMVIDGGTTNFLAGFVNGTPLRTSLAVNNSNTGVGTAVTLNVQTSVFFRGLNGNVATPLSGTNTATVNLAGSSTELGLSGMIIPGGTFAGVISGDGRVSLALGQLTDTQTFSGNNTYKGTTTVNGGTLRINGMTSGQGNYVVNNQSSGARLTGSGTIGLAANGTVAVGGANGGQLSTGGDSATGTLNVVTSGIGGVIFGQQSLFLADIGPSGASDLLAIAGGYIDLTSSTDTLTLNALSFGFDGSSYTIATFTQNLGSGTFNTVTGLPANYAVAYLPNSIMLLPIPEPATWALGVEALTLLIWTGSRMRKARYSAGSL